MYIYAHKNYRTQKYSANMKTIWIESEYILLYAKLRFHTNFDDRAFLFSFDMCMLILTPCVLNSILYYMALHSAFLRVFFFFCFFVYTLYFRNVFKCFIHI